MNETPQTLQPTGTVTFLFSDIEGSTERWERHRDAMQDALRLHDAADMTLQSTMLRSRER